jgi:protein-L-isoaspartate(D-aspartate) O-methyltransferase
MVDAQIHCRGVRDINVLNAMRGVPREAFVDAAFEKMAYEDRPLPIGEGQTISQPYIVALMIEAAEVRHGDYILEVGAGSGYASAVISQIAAQVYAIERHASLIEVARERFLQLGYYNVTLRLGDGTKGWPEAAPFDAILVSAGSSEVPSALMDQLAPWGRLIIPLGANQGRERLVKITREGRRVFGIEYLEDVSFVPLIADQTDATNRHTQRPRFL